MAFGDFTVTRASTKLRIGSNGLYGSVANNVPAFEFNTDGSYRGLLVEPGATNLALRSQEFQTSWTTLQASISTDVVATTAPDGTNTADKLVENTATDEHRVTQSITKAASATTYTVSVFAKSTERNMQLAIDSGSVSNAGQAIFNLTNGTVGSATVDGTFTNASASIQALPNGWYRCSVTATTGTETTVRIRIRLVSGASTVSYTGDNTSGIFIWQGQLETGPVATSPIVTAGSTASRVADAITLTSASSLIGQSEGTLYAEALPILSAGTISRCVFEVSDATDSNLVQLEYQSFGSPPRYRLNSQVRQGGVSLYNLPESNTGGLTTETVIKLALAYKNSDYNAFANGVAVTGTPTGSGTLTNLNVSRVDIGQRRTGANQFNGWIRSVALYPTRLDNATLATLTTL
jgi:hypothetical protein